MAFLDLVNELTGTIVGLSPLLAKKYINRAYEHILKERRWGFLYTDGVVVCPAMITTGTVSITQYSADVTLDADASAAILPQCDPAAVPGILQMQMRFGTSPQLGGMYSIIAFDAISDPTAIVLTFDRVVQESTNATSTYQFYRALITPPMDDFLRFDDMVDIANYIDIAGPRLTHTSSQFDARDPQRTSQGLAYYLGAWGGNRINNAVTGATVPNATVNQGTPIYELWPHPTQGQTWYCRIVRKGVLLVQPTDEPEPGISTEAIMTRALGWHAYPFAKANQSNFPTMRGTNWDFLILSAKADYKTELTVLRKQDDAQQLRSVWNRGHGLRSMGTSGVPFPIDAQFIQSHLLNWYSF